MTKKIDSLEEAKRKTVECSFQLEAASSTFLIVSELSGQEIVCVSGVKSVSSFTEISSLVGFEIRAAYAGCDLTLFEKREGKIISCGANDYGQLLLSSGPSENVYSPREMTIL